MTPYKYLYISIKSEPGTFAPLCVAANIREEQNVEDRGSSDISPTFSLSKTKK
jgi:hypothetical protein